MAGLQREMHETWSLPLDETILVQPLNLTLCPHPALGITATGDHRAVSQILALRKRDSVQ